MYANKPHSKLSFSTQNCFGLFHPKIIIELQSRVDLKQSKQIYINRNLLEKKNPFLNKWKKINHFRLHLKSSSIYPIKHSESLPSENNFIWLNFCFTDMPGIRWQYFLFWKRLMLCKKMLISYIFFQSLMLISTLCQGQSYSIYNNPGRSMITGFSPAFFRQGFGLLSGLSS